MHRLFSICAFVWLEYNTCIKVHLYYVVVLCYCGISHYFLSLLLIVFHLSVKDNPSIFFLHAYTYSHPLTLSLPVLLALPFPTRHDSLRRTRTHTLWTMLHNWYFFLCLTHLCVRTVWGLLGQLKRKSFPRRPLLVCAVFGQGSGEGQM